MEPSTNPLPVCNGCDAPEPTEGNYFVSTYPPFSCWTADQVDAVTHVLNKSQPVPNKNPLGLYLHIPFCAERCEYCYYRSYAKPTHEQTDRYIDTLLTELIQPAAAPAVTGRPLDFAYFGGGTPSLLSAAQIKRLLAGVSELLPLNAAREVTFECAPQSATPERLAVLRESGVTRISLGVQQLNDDVLKKSGRIHRVESVERAVADIKQLDFPVVNLDLMVGLVGETEETFFNSLNRIIELQPVSVTIYLLEIPANTPLYQAMQTNADELQPAGWDIKRDRLARAFERLEQNGYAVRSGYAVVRKQETAGFVYQEAQYKGADLICVGLSSFGYFDGVHYQNQASLDRYLDSVSEFGHARVRACELTEEERMAREFVLQLKLGGARADYFKQKFGVDLSQQFALPLAACSDRGWLTFDQNGVTLTRAGLLRVDRLIPAFYLPQHRDKTYW